MAHVQITGKRLQISKANSTMVIVVAVASFITTFSLVACKTLQSQRSYQGRVIEKKEQARDTLNQNIQNVDKLAIAYQEFTSRPDNIIGGNPSGKGEQDGDNAKIVLDALPSKYDFPALTTSIEKLVKSKNYGLLGITGNDDEVAQAANQGAASPAPIEIPIQVTLQVDSYKSLKPMFELFERSIKPFKFQQLSITSNDASIEVEASLVNYYQPARTIEISKEVVR